MNTSNPVLTHIEPSRLEDGIEIEVVGETFSKPIFEGGDPLVYNMVKLINKRGGHAMGVAYYANPMDQEELEVKVKEIAKSPDQFVAPLYKQKSQN